MKKSVPIIIVSLLFIIAYFYLCKSNPKYFKDNLVEFKYYSGGGHNGGYTTTTIKEDNGEMKLIVKEAKNYYAPVLIKTYKIDNEALNEIKKYIIDKKFYRISKKANSSIVVSDGITQKYEFIFETSDFFSISSEQRLSKLDRKYLAELINYIEDLKIEEPEIGYEQHQLMINISNKLIYFILNDSNTSLELYNYISENNETEVELKDYDFGKYFSLETKLDISDAVKANGGKGDMVYLPSEDKIIIFYKDYNVTDEMYEIGVNDKNIPTLDLLISSKNCKIRTYR